MSAKIYTLNCPLSNVPKYIGQTIRPLRLRLNSHIQQAKPNTPKNCWLLSLKKNCLKPKIEELDEVPKGNVSFWEQFYISLFKSWGFELKNATNGGEGIVITKEVIEKFRQAKLGKKLSESHKKKIVEARKGYRHSQETRNKIGAANKISQRRPRGPHTEEHKSNIGKGNIGKKRTEDQLKKIRELTHMKKLAEADVLKIIKLRVEDNLEYKEISTLFSISKSTACDIVKGRTWRHITKNKINV